MEEKGKLKQSSKSITSSISKNNKKVTRSGSKNSVADSSLKLHQDWENITNITFIYSRKTLTMLAVKGIPNHLRPQFWFLISGAKHEMSQNPGYYNFLLNNYPVPLPFEKQIDLDLKRTFPEDPYFRDYKVIKKLKNILTAYSRRNVSLGYIQGFNFIVGKLLKQIPNEEEVFYLFINIIEDKLPLNFYSEMCGLMADVDIMIKILIVYCPRLIQHLEEYDLLDFLKNVLLQWFLSVFTHNFNEDFTYFILDVFFIQGGVVLLKVAYHLIKESEDKLMMVTNLIELKSILDRGNSTSSIYSGDLAELKLKLLEDFILDDHVLNMNRYNISKYIEKNIREYNKSKIERRKNELFVLKNEEKEVQCDPEWPICLYDVEAFYEINEVLIVRSLKTLKMEDLIIEDYFYNLENNSDESDKTTSSSSFLCSFCLGNANESLKDSHYNSNAKLSFGNKANKAHGNKANTVNINSEIPLVSKFCLEENIEVNDDKVQLINSNTFDLINSNDNKQITNLNNDGNNKLFNHQITFKDSKNISFSKNIDNEYNGTNKNTVSPFTLNKEYAKYCNKLNNTNIQDKNLLTHFDNSNSKDHEIDANEYPLNALLKSQESVKSKNNTAYLEANNPLQNIENSTSQFFCRSSNKKVSNASNLNFQVCSNCKRKVKTTLKHKDYIKNSHSKYHLDSSRKLSMKNAEKANNNKKLIINKSDQITYEDVLLERRNHTEFCLNEVKLFSNKNLCKQMENNEISTKSIFDVKFNESVDFGMMKPYPVANMRNSDLEPKLDYINQLRNYKGKLVKSISTFYYPRVISENQNDETDFNTFVVNLKNRYNKVTQIKNICLNLIEKNRQKMKMQ